MRTEVRIRFDSSDIPGGAQTILGRDAVEWARAVTARPVARRTLRADDIPLPPDAEVTREGTAETPTVP